MNPFAAIPLDERFREFHQRYPALDLADATLGVWGALAAADRLLRDRDRVEVYRPLLVDPKEARRRRQQQQREQAAAARKGRRR